MPSPTETAIPARGVYRSRRHLAIWNVIDRAHIWERVGIDFKQMEYCASPLQAEAALLDGSIDFISGNHLTPYDLIADGKPIVSIASPENFKTLALVSTQPVSSVEGLRGMRLAETPSAGRKDGFRHSTGNHMLCILKSGLRLDDVEWIDIEGKNLQLEALLTGEADAVFVDAGTDISAHPELYSLKLEPLPMITGPTMTTCLTALEQKPGLGERLVKAIVLAVHYARTNPEDTKRILDECSKRSGKLHTHEGVAGMSAKPYPDPQAVINAHELSCMKSPRARQVNPLALWDLHFLRMLDQSGFIDRLYSGGRPTE